MIAQRAVRGAGIVLISSYTNMAIGIIYGIIIARLLNPDQFGLVALATFFVTLIDLRGKLGLDYAYIHRQQTNDELIATHWTLQMGASALTLLLTFVTAAILTRLGYPDSIVPVMIMLAAGMIIESAGTTARAELEKELIFMRSSAVVTGALLISYLTAIALALKGYGYWALVGQVVVNVALSSAGFWWSFLKVKQRPSIRFSFNRAMARWMLRFGATIAVGAIATTLLLQFDNFLVGTFLGTATLGYYAQAYKVAQWPTGLVTHVVSRAALPTYAKLQTDAARLSKAFEMSLWLILTLATPIALAIFITAPDFLQLLWGEKWLPSAILLRFLIAYSILRPLLDDTGALFTATGRPKLITIVLMAQATALIVFATPLTINRGAIGTTIGVGIAFAVGVALAYWFISRTLSIHLVRVFVPPVIGAVGSVALYFVVASLIDMNALPLFLRVIVKGGFTVSAFIVIVSLIERRTLLDRVSYILRLLRGSPT